MKLPESAAFQLFDKYHIFHPKIGVKTGKVVVKADLALGGKGKAGLVKICDASEISRVSKEMGVSVIVEEFIPHKKEHYVALKAVRGGIETYYCDEGGVDIEQNWGKVKKTLSQLSQFSQFYKFFQEEDATYLEINPYTEKMMPLGVVLEVDDSARYRHTDWPEVKENFKSEREKIISGLDAQIKGSVKLVEVPGGGNTAVMGGGAGAVLFLCDAIINRGLKLANYAEFSGNPPAFAVSELTRQVCAIPGIRNLVIGSGIANFTDVKSNIEGIIAGLKVSPQAKSLNIVVRRCGPGELEAKKMMEDFAKESGLKIKVFGRETPMTQIVKYV